MANKIKILIESIFKKTGVDDAEKSVSGLGKSLTGLNSILAGLGLALTTKEMFDFGVQAFQSAAQADRLASATDNLAKAIGASGDDIISGVQAAAQGMVTQTQAAQAANKALMFGLIDNKAEMEDLTRIAITLGNAMGQNAGKSIDDLTTALGRQSPMILDNLGITLKLEEAYQIYADSLGKSVEQLTEQEKKQAFVNAALEKGRQRVEELGGVTVGAAGQIDQLATAWSEFYVEFGRLLSAMNESTGAIDAVTAAIKRLKDGAEAWQGVFENNATLTDINARATENLKKKYELLDTQLYGVRVSTDEWKAAQAEAAAQLAEEARQTQYVNAQTKIYENAERLAKKAAEERAISALNVARALDIETQASNRARNAEALRMQAIADSASQEDMMRMTGVDTLEQQQVAASIEAYKDSLKEIPETLSDTFKDTADDLSNQLSGAVSEAFGRMQETVPGLSDMFATEDPGEFGRRLGALADGLDPSDMGFIDRFKEQAGGNPIYAALLQAIEQSDSAAVGAEATRLMSENLADVIATGLAENLAAKMREQDLLAQAQAILAEQMGQAMPTAEGEAGTGLKDAATTSGEVQTALTDMGISTEDFKGKAVTAFAEAKKGGDEFVKTLQEIERITQRINANLETMTTNGQAQASKFGITPGAAVGGMTPQ